MATGQVVIMGLVAVRAKVELVGVIARKFLGKGDAELNLGPAIGIAGVCAELEVALVGEPDPLVALPLLLGTDLDVGVGEELGLVQTELAREGVQRAVGDTARDHLEVETGAVTLAVSKAVELVG